MLHPLINFYQFTFYQGCGFGGEISRLLNIKRMKFGF